MEKTYGPDLRFTDVFASTHTTETEQGTKWVDDRAKHTFELYRTSVARNVPEDSDLPWKPDVWVEVATQGRKKRGQCLYGFGDYGVGVNFPPEAASECTPGTSQQPRQNAEVNQELEERVQLAESRFETLAATYASLHDKLENFISSHSSSAPSSSAPPSSAPSSSAPPSLAPPSSQGH